MKKDYKIIEIVNENTVLVDYGTENGAHTGDKLEIYSVGAPVKIGEINYGTMDEIKDVVTIVTAYPLFSICKKVIRSVYNPLSPLSALQRTMTSLHPLNVDDKELSNRNIPTGGARVHVGDFVRVID